MRHFATRVARAKASSIRRRKVKQHHRPDPRHPHRNTSSDTTVYDPTCGSGSLLLKVADQARSPVTLYGQEKTPPPAASPA